MVVMTIETRNSGLNKIFSGIGGFAAYVGISNVAAPKQGQVVYISAAAGGVGQLAGQFSKLNNCYVVGSAGTDEKVNDLKYYMFNFDGYFNYKKRRFRGSFNKVSDVQMVLTYILTMWEGPCWMKCCCT
ncbi:hypothetical protein T459_17180 [Capsicum annuum]|uniref:2-alkenal reductase (NADP(+)-dependent)-like n=1 Tax=Capsicum annuum TaxID=4072 RepID=A0A2G2ZAV0_CAPAN|nr:hypothetical protein T459_17180 [Capsicum annuum]